MKAYWEKKYGFKMHNLHSPTFRQEILGGGRCGGREKKKSHLFHLKLSATIFCSKDVNTC
jgi:hypothetical protein